MLTSTEPQAPPPGAGAPWALDDLELATRYRAYRRRQAARLLQLIPRDAVRPLYRRALEELSEGERGPRADPLALLTRYCESLLPLPPRELWAADLAHNPEGHLHDLAESVHGPTAEEPATLEARTVESEGRAWRVRLRAFQAPDAWRGFMVFQDVADGSSFRTAVVFCEPDPIQLRDRFRSFEPTALGAFLRSARP